MELTRTIHPIGQGGFYTETLKDGDDEINVVYDCGGFNRLDNSPLMNNYIVQNLEKDKEIDIVFISHLDWDHINGLECLLAHCNVKYLFLPQLTEDEKYAIILYNMYVLGISFTRYFTFYKFLFKILIGVISSDTTKIVWVSKSTNISIIGIRNDIDIKNINLKNGEYLKKGTRIHFHHKWFYIPYNPPAPQNTGKNIKDEFNKLFPNVDFKDLPNKMKGNLQQCRGIYKSCFVDQNSCSMTLFSGSIETKMYYIGIECFKNNDNANCLYMGDFVKDYIDNLIWFYRKYWKVIATIQVPHHGSNDNNSYKLYEYAYRGFISVGSTNKDHPGNTTMITMTNHRCQSLIVTEEPSTKKIFHYTDVDFFDSNQEIMNSKKNKKVNKNGKSSKTEEQTDELVSEQKPEQEQTTEIK